MLVLGMVPVSALAFVLLFGVALELVLILALARVLVLVLELVLVLSFSCYSCLNITVLVFFHILGVPGGRGGLATAHPTLPLASGSSRGRFAGGDLRPRTFLPMVS